MMKIEFMGGPRDGDYTYQGYAPPLIYQIPETRSLSEMIHSPVRPGVSNYPFVSYHTYVSEGEVDGVMRYQYSGITNGEE